MFNDRKHGDIKVKSSLKKDPTEEKKAIIQATLDAHQPRRLIRLLQSNVSESINLIRHFKPDPVLALVRAYFIANRRVILI
jgi:hypothetical protein